MSEYDRLLDRIVRLYDIDPKLHWDWVDYQKSQEHRLPPGPGSKIMAVSTEIMKEYLASLKETEYLECGICNEVIGKGYKGNWVLPSGTKLAASVCENCHTRFGWGLATNVVDIETIELTSSQKLEYFCIKNGMKVTK